MDKKIEKQIVWLAGIIGGFLILRQSIDNDFGFGMGIGIFIIGMWALWTIEILNKSLSK